MNRQIKFRGKRISTGEWVCGDLLTTHVIDKDADKEYTRYEIRGFQPNFGPICFTVDEQSIGQYIGLNDANGNEIYEGDILTDSYYDWGNEKDVEYYITVEWDEPSYGFIVSQSDYHDEVEMHHLAYKEIIGNVHDNPELQKLFE